MISFDPDTLTPPARRYSMFLVNITRESIISTLTDALRNNPLVHALWLEGSDAHGLADEYSDIDLWLDVEDGSEEDVLRSIKDIAHTIGPIDYEYIGANPDPQIRQAFLHIEGTPEFWILDICIQSHSRQVALTRGFADEKITVLFDKSGVIRYADADWPALQEAQKRRAAELASALPRARTLLRKELCRGNFLEALHYYHEGLLRPLVELLRIRHQPTKQGFYLKHISRDLPGDVVALLEDLHAVSSLEEISMKSERASSILRELTGGTQ